jgi:FlaA1/EpsC-like NDP-sugar epimerase
MHKAIVIGVGGHSRAVIDVLLSCGKHKVVGLLDLNEAKSNEFVLGVPVIGSIHSIEH